MANNKIAYGLAKEHGIDTTGMSPKEVWDALRKKGISQGKIEQEQKEVLADRYTSDDAKPYEPPPEKQNNGATEKPKFGGKSSADFAKALTDAKATLLPKDAWRVASHTQQELDTDYKGAKLHITTGGSTVAVTTDGDIVAVCRKYGDSQRGRDLVKLAVENGGTKLDSFSGNHDFYLKCGFEPVSWCKFNKEFAPSDWKDGRDGEEPIVFYRYTGKVTTEKFEDFTARIPASADYGEAQTMRDKSREK